MHSPARALFVCLVAVAMSSPGMPGQARRPARPQRPASAKSSPPPFLEHVLSYNDSQYVTRAVMKNGLTVLLHEFRAVPVVGVTIWIKGGTADEPANAPGISRVLARLLPFSTESRGPGILEKDIRAAGGEWTPDAAFDHVALDVAMPSAQWKRALELMADAYWNPLLDEAGARREIERAIAESRAVRSSPKSFVLSSYLETAYSKNGLRNALEPDPEALQSITTSRLREHFKSAFAPARTLLIVSGDIIAVEVMNEVARLFSRPAPSPAYTPNTVREPAQDAFRYREIRTDTPNPFFALGFHVPSESSSDDAVVRVISALLSAGESSVLRRRLQYEKGLIGRGKAEVITTGVEASLLITGAIESSSLDRAEIAIATELELLRTKEVDEVEMERALSAVEREHWDRLQTVSARSHALAEAECLGDWRRVDTFPARVRDVKPADVKRVAARYLSLDKATLVEFLPREAEARNITAETLYRTLQELAGPSAEQEQTERDQKPVSAVEIPTEPSAFKFSEVRMPFQLASVLRGPDLYIREVHTAPLVHLGIFLPGGRLAETPESRGLTEMMLRAMMLGTKNREMDQYWRQLEVYGARAVPIVRDDYFGFEMTILSSHVEPGLDLLIDMMRYPKFDQESIERLQKTIGLRAPGRGPVEQAESSLRSALFGDHPYGVEAPPAVGSDAAAIQTWYKSEVGNRKPLAVIIGDTKGTSLAQYFVRNFSGSRMRDAGVPEVVPKPAQPAAIATAALNESDGAAAIGFQAPPEGDDDSYALRVLTVLLDGSGGRLAEQLVQKQGVAFEVSARYTPLRRAGELSLEARVVAGREEEAAKSLQDEIRRLLETPPLYKEYRTAMNLAVGRFWVRQQDRFSQLEMLVRNELAGLSLAGMTETPERIKEVRQEDLEEIAKRFLKLEKAVIVTAPGKAEAK